LIIGVIGRAVEVHVTRFKKEEGKKTGIMKKKYEIETF